MRERRKGRIKLPRRGLLIIGWKWFLEVCSETIDILFWWIQRLRRVCLSQNDPAGQVGTSVKEKERQGKGANGFGFRPPLQAPSQGVGAKKKLGHWIFSSFSRKEGFVLSLHLSWQRKRRHSLNTPSQAFLPREKSWEIDVVTYLPRAQLQWCAGMWVYVCVVLRPLLGLDTSAPLEVVRSTDCRTRSTPRLGRSVDDGVCVAPCGQRQIASTRPKLLIKRWHIFNRMNLIIRPCCTLGTCGWNESDFNLPCYLRQWARKMRLILMPARQLSFDNWAWTDVSGWAGSGDKFLESSRMWINWKCNGCRRGKVKSVNSLIIQTDCQTSLDSLLFFLLDRN